MNKKNIFIGLIALVILLAIIRVADAIWGDVKRAEQTPEPIVGENLDGEADPSRMTLDMTTWNWVVANYNDGRVVKPLSDKKFTLKFNPDGSFSATTDCNSMGGKYVADKASGTIAFSQIFSTKMYCEGSQESEFAKLIENTSGYRFTSRGQLILDLKFDSGTATFR